jgi:hypothetical protein
MSLFSTLMRSIYAVDGANGEFLADLTRPIPYHQSTAETREATLAEIPAVRHRRIVDSIQWHEEAVAEAISFAMEDRDDYSQESVVEILTDLDHPSAAAEHVQMLRGDLRELRIALTQL